MRARALPTPSSASGLQGSRTRDPEAPWQLHSARHVRERRAPERSQLDINQCRNVDSASSKSVRIAEIRFTQNFIFTFSDDLHHRLAFTGGLRPPGPREEDTAGARRMPWHGKPKKGAASCDKPRGGANGLRSGDSRMGEPSRGHALLPAPESIGCEEATGGTETSKYPEERKSTETPGVAASETGPEPKPAHVQATGRCCAGVAGRAIPRACSLGRSYKATRKRNGMGRPAAAGESPVRGSVWPPRRVPE